MEIKSDRYLNRSISKKILLIIIGLLVSIIIIILSSSTASAETPRYLHVNSITMELDGPDATFTVDYELDIVAKIYVLFLGSGNIEPAINDIFFDFDNYKIVNVRDNYAVVIANDISYKDPSQIGNFYFHDAHDLGVRVDTFNLVFPTGITRTFNDVSSTKNTFFEDK
jgi:hypothetical protein